MHFSAVTCTVLPKLSTWLAPVGQQVTQGGLSQWLQRSERISSERLGNSPRVSVTIQSRQCPWGTSFSVWQATTQSMHPTHFRVSMTIPKRGMSRLLHESDEVPVDARPAHKRVDLVARVELPR